MLENGSLFKVLNDLQKIKKIPQSYVVQDGVAIARISIYLTRFFSAPKQGHFFYQSFQPLEKSENLYW